MTFHLKLEEAAIIDGAGVCRADESGHTAAAAHVARWR